MQLDKKTLYFSTKQALNAHDLVRDLAHAHWHMAENIHFYRVI